MARLELSAGSKARAFLMGGVLAFAMLALSVGARAQDKPQTNLDQAISTLDAALKNEPGLSEATKNALSQVVGILRTERAEVVTNDKLEKMIEDYSKKGASAYVRRKSYESIFD